jgi:hypothetical protein
MYTLINSTVTTNKHTHSTRNRATGFSFKEPSSGLWQKLWKTNFIHFLRGQLPLLGERGSFPLTKCKLKLVAWLHVEALCVGCDCAIDKSEIYFCLFSFLGRPREFAKLRSTNPRNTRDECISKLFASRRSVRVNRNFKYCFCYALRNKMRWTVVLQQNITVTFIHLTYVILNKQTNTIKTRNQKETDRRWLIV